jgi:hypothetical protein
MPPRIEVPGGIHSQVPYSSSPRRRMSNAQCRMSPHFGEPDLDNVGHPACVPIEHTQLLL